MPADVSAPLPQLDLREFAIVSVEIDDPGAVITSIVVHGWQQLPPGAVADLPAILTLQPIDEPPL
jgi:hypothetical protein